MKSIKNLGIFLLLWVLIAVTGCKDYVSLESIKISSVAADVSDDVDADKYVCKSSASGGSGSRQFIVTGYYNDDDTEDLTAEVKWTTDATDDTVLSVVSGLIRCSTAYGVIGVLATYTVNNSDSGSEDGEETNEMTDSIVVDGK